MADFTPAEEVESILVVPLELAEKAARDFFREEWVEWPGIIMLTEDLVVAVVLREPEEAEEAAEGTLVEAVEIMNGTPAGEGEVLTMLEQINKTSVATTQLAMVRLPLHLCRKIKTCATTN